VIQLSESYRATDPVCHETEVALELGKGSMSAVAEDPVDTTRIEPEPAQPLLHLGDVVSVQHRAATVQKPVPQAEAGFDEARPCLVVTDAVNPKAALGLESLHGLRGRGTVGSQAVLSMAESESLQSSLQIDYGFT
jgi:hypothetical protein